MAQHQIGFKKTLNQNMPNLKTIWSEHWPGFYLFLKINWVLISNKIRIKRKTLKIFYKKTIKNFKIFLKPLIAVYIVFIGQKSFKKRWFLSNNFVKKPSTLYEKYRFFKTQNKLFGFVQKKLKHKTT